MAVKFLRRDNKRFTKLGKNRKKLQKWRKPKGRDNKMRLGMAGYPKTVRVGYKKKKTESGKINGKETVLVKTFKDLENVGKNKTVIIGKVGAKKRIELVKKARELGLEICNMPKTKEIKK